RESEPILPALFSTGIEALDKVLPKGIPRNSMMILAGELGTGKSVLMSQLLYGVLKRRKEPCIYMTFEGPPLAVEQDMESFGWDIAPFLESGQLRFIDCFSFRMEPVEVPSYVHYVKDPRDLHSVTSALGQTVQGPQDERRSPRDLLGHLLGYLERRDRGRVARTCPIDREVAYQQEEVAHSTPASTEGLWPFITEAITSIKPIPVNPL